MIKQIVSLAVALSLMCGGAWAEIKLQNAGNATLDDLIREKALVTIVLKGGVPDTNLTLTGVNDTTVTFVTSTGQNKAYTVNVVQSIRVQERRMAEKQSVLSKGSLSTDEQAIVDQCLLRVTKIWQDNRDPSIRMQATSIAASMGDEGALLYLQGHAQGNSVPMQIEASRYLWLAGEEIDTTVLLDGFANGDRNVRSLSATLAGLVGATRYTKDIFEMSANPSEDVYPYAIRALAKIGDRAALPKMYDGLSALRQKKTEAAIYGLTTLGGEDVVREMKRRLNGADSSEWFRLVRILYALDDELGEKLMREEALPSFAHSKAAGLLLAEDDEWNGVLSVREYLDKKADPTLPNLLYRAEVASALYNTAQSEAKIKLQELMRMSDPAEVFAKGTSDQERKEILGKVHKRVCQVLGEKGDKTMLSLLYAPMESENVEVSLAACQAIAMTANPDFRDRVTAMADYTGERELLLPEIFK